MKKSTRFHRPKLLVLLATLPAIAHAAEKKETPLFNEWLHASYPETHAWDVGAEFRGRYEIKDDAGVTPNTDFLAGIAEGREAFYFREKVHVGYKCGWFGAFVEARDASGHEDVRADDVFDLHQAYVTLGDPKQFPLTATIGRQEMTYGDQRFIGKGDWSNYGRSFDAIKLRMENSFGWVDVFTSRVVIPDHHNFNVSNDYDAFSGIYTGSKKLLPWQDTHAYFIARNASAKAPDAIAPGFPAVPSSARDIYTLGTLWKSDPERFCGWDYSMELAYQFGSVNRGGQRLDQSSYAIFLDTGFTWKDAWGKPRVGLGYEFGSGDEDPTDGDVGTMDNLFGTQHRPYGLMDLAGARNMHIPRLTFSIKPVKGLTFSVDWLAFILDDTNDFFYPESGGGRGGNGYGINPTYDSFVGTELDIYANYAINKWSNCQLGYGHFFTGDYIDDTAENAGRGTADADWFYAQLTLTF